MGQIYQSLGRKSLNVNIISVEEKKNIHINIVVTKK